jgi:poly-gamma-glutamate synthesis protein (capsule biosynthesis protein)
MSDPKPKNSQASEKALRPITVFMCGDVMTGRGIDQVLPHPCNPAIHEPFMKNARGYVEIAEQANGPIEKPVGFSYIWGDALDELKRAAPDVRIINLETSVTASDHYWEGKGINYRMHPDNVAVLTAAGIDICALANNHVLDWGYTGLAETLAALHHAGIRTAGAGKNDREARAAAAMTVPGKGRVVVFSFGLRSSGILSNWAANDTKPGVYLLADLSERSLGDIRQQTAAVRREGDVVVASIHWGSNWGHDISRRQRRFAHRLIDAAGVDIVHGHSSHHVRAIEIYRNKLILYGCGDFLNDYEGIGGHEEFRGDLSLMYFATVDPATGRLLKLEMTPTQVRRFQIVRASGADTRWLKDTLNRQGAAFGTRAVDTGDGRLCLQWD